MIAINWLALQAAAYSAYPDLAAIDGKTSNAAVVEKMLRDLSSKPEIIRANLRLVVGIELCRDKHYNKALDVLNSLSVSNVVAPAELLFHRSLCQFRLLQRRECSASIAKLLERESELPGRFAKLAQLVRLQLHQIKPDSLSEIAHLMGNIKTRLHQGSAGRRVRDEESDVVTKLDRLIADLDRKGEFHGPVPDDPPRGSDPPRGPRHDSPGGPRGPKMKPTDPLPDTRKVAGRGAGAVDDRKIKSKSWGNISPKRRLAVLQNVSRDLPTHYRGAIEAYFIKLARDGMLK